MVRICRLIVLGLSSFLAALGSARAAGPANALFTLAPPESSMTIALEDLRGQARAFFESPLAARLDAWPVFQAWRASNRFKAFQEAVSKLEVLVGEKRAVLRDDLLGEAVVLSMILPKEGDPGEARGLLLAQVRNRDLVARFQGAIESAQLKSGELIRITSRTYLGTSYRLREYRNPRRPIESYAMFEDGTFAWSNSDALIQGVIERHAGKSEGLGADPKFQDLRRRLPARAILSVFVSPSTLARFLSAAASARKPGDERLARLIARYADAIQGAGAALEVRDGIFVQTEESLDPKKLDPWLRRWAARSTAPTPRRAVAVDALAAGSVQVDFESLLDLIAELTPEPDRNRLELMQLMMKGAFQGHELRTEVAPRLGPGVGFSVESRPEAEGALHFPAVAHVDLQSGKDGLEMAAVLENGLRTLLASYALNAKHGGGRLRLSARPIEGIVVNGLEPSGPVQFAVSDGRLALGNDAPGIVRSLVPALEGGPESPFEAWRQAYFPAAGSFVCVDLQGLQQVAVRHRGALIAALAARSHATPERVACDLDQVAALGSLFRGGFVTSTIRTDATAIQRRLGLLAREDRP